MLTPKLKTFLDESHVPYSCIKHSPAFTTAEIAEAAHIPGQQVAKTVIINIGGKLAMVILPSNQQVNFSVLQKIIDKPAVLLATEDEFQSRFPDCELGMMPPFGNLYGMDVFVSSSLEKDETIVFNGGDYSELVQLAYQDFKKLVHPKVLNFA